MAFWDLLGPQPRAFFIGQNKMNFDVMRLTSRIKKKESLRLKPYRCPAGKLTIGYGRNLEDNGISVGEAEMMLRNDMFGAHYDACKLPWFGNLMDVRQAAVVEMIYNMGLPRFVTFRKMIEALIAGDYEGAAREALDSKWARQVGKRAEEVAQMFRSGLWPETD